MTKDQIAELKRQCGLSIAEISAINRLYVLDLIAALEAAQAEVARLSARVDALEDSMNPQDVQTVDAGIADREARMKALGAAEWLRGYLTGLFNAQPEEYKGAALKPLTDELTRLESEATRLAEKTDNGQE